MTPSRTKSPTRKHMMPSVPPFVAEPLISVVCCTHNRNEFVRRHLDMMRPHLNAEIELVYALDNCTDDTLPFLRSAASALPSVRIAEHQGERGLFNCRNFALAQARGRYIHFLDDDDSVEPGFYTMLAEAMKAHANSEVDIFLARLQTWWPDGSRTDRPPFAGEWASLAQRSGGELHLQGDLFMGILGGKIYYNGCNALFRTRLLRQYGYRQGFKKSADWLFNLESALGSPLHLVYVESAVANYFIHANSMSLGADKAVWNARIFDVLMQLTEKRPVYHAAVRPHCAEGHFSAGYALRHNDRARAFSHYVQSMKLGMVGKSLLAIAKLALPR